MNTLTNILVVDDSANDIFLLEQAFQRAEVGSRLQSAQDGLEARAYLLGEGDFADRAAHPFPDVLLLDLNMPRMNGFEFLEWLRQEPAFRGLVVHVLTASARDGDLQRAFELGANSYVIKPSRVSELIEFVTALHEWHRFAAFPQTVTSEAIPQSH